MIAYLSGARGLDVDATAVAVEHQQAILPPVVLSELLSDPKLPRVARDSLRLLPLLEILDGYWERAGLLRSRTIAAGRKARLADSLIAQVCLDHDVVLISRDEDFRHLARTTGLRLITRAARA
jgi:predicted nucleic acid-binding protein